MARTKEKKQSAAASLVELVTIVAVALGLALGIQAFLVKPFRIPSESMVPTLAVGQRVLVDRVSERFSDPDRGDVMVFKPPRGADDNVCGVEKPDTQACPRPTRERSETNFIKRVVGLPGDRLKVVNNRVYVNGRRQTEPFVNRGTPCDQLCNLDREITVPKDHYFMMGENSGASADSREWGPVPKKWMIGKAFLTYWPPGKVGTL